MAAPTRSGPVRQDKTQSHIESNPQKPEIRLEREARKGGRPHFFARSPKPSIPTQKAIYAIAEKSLFLAHPDTGSLGATRKNKNRSKRTPL
jgi:hypothetical protein